MFCKIVTTAASSLAKGNKVDLVDGLAWSGMKNTVLLISVTIPVYNFLKNYL